MSLQVTCSWPIKVPHANDLACFAYQRQCMHRSPVAQDGGRDDGEEEEEEFFQLKGQRKASSSAAAARDPADSDDGAPAANTGVR